MADNDGWEANPDLGWEPNPDLAAPQQAPLAQLQSGPDIMDPYGLASAAGGFLRGLANPKAVESVATGLGASVVGGVAGLVHAAQGDAPARAAAAEAGLDYPEENSAPDTRSAADVINEVSQRLTVQPKDEQDKRDVEALSKVLNIPADVGHYVGEKVQDLGAPPWLAAGIDTAGQLLAGSPLGLKGVRGIRARAAASAAESADFARAMDADLSTYDRASRAPETPTAPSTAPATVFSPDDRHQAKLDNLLDSLGDITEDQRQKIIDYHGDVERDPVTGAYTRRELVPSIEAAKEDGGAYGEVDVKNLGGVNGAIGSSAADVHLKAAQDIIDKHVQAAADDAGAEAHIVRKGGDEFGVIAKGMHPDDLDAALSDAKDELDQYAKDNNLDQIPHTKEGKEGGFGINYGTSEIADRPTSDILSEADTLVEKRKAGEPYEQRGTDETAGTGTPDRGAPAHTDAGAVADAQPVAEQLQPERAAQGTETAQRPAGTAGAEPAGADSQRSASPLPGNLHESLDEPAANYARALVNDADPEMSAQATAWLEANAGSPDRVAQALHEAAAKHNELDAENESQRTQAQPDVPVNGRGDTEGAPGQPGHVDEGTDARTPAREPPANGPAETDLAAAETGAPGQVRGPGEQARVPEREQAPADQGRGGGDVQRAGGGQPVEARNAAMDAERTRMALEPLESADRHGWEAASQEALDNLRQNPDAGRHLVQELNAKPRPISDTETMTLVHHYKNLRDAEGAAHAAVADAAGRGDVVGEARGHAALADITGQMEGTQKALRSAGTESSRGMNIRQAALKDDYSVGRNMDRVRTSFGDKFNEGIGDQVKSLSDQIRQRDEEIARLKARDNAAPKTPKKQMTPDERQQAKIQRQIDAKMKGINDLQDRVNRRLKACPL